MSRVGYSPLSQRSAIANAKMLHTYIRASWVIFSASVFYMSGTNCLKALILVHLQVLLAV